MSVAELRCLGGILAGEAIELGAAGLAVGRATQEPGPLGGDARLSREHAHITVTAAGSVIIEDLGSTNGTWVNDMRIAEPTPLEDGDEIRMGRTTLALAFPPVPPETLAGAGPTTLPRAAHRPEPTPSDLVLEVPDGPLAGSEIRVSDELLIGRGHRGDGALAGDKALSRHHARIARGPERRFYIEDTGSTNGTFLNDAQLRFAQPLASGDEIAVGSTRLSVRSAPLASAPTEPRPQPPLAGAFVPRGAADSRVPTHRLVAVFAAIFAGAVGAAVAGIALVAPAGPHKCPAAHPCNPVAKAAPLREQTLYRSSEGWSVEYEAQRMSVVEQKPSSLELSDPRASELKLTVASMPASQASPQAAIQTARSSLEQRVVGLQPDTEPQDQMFGIPAVGFHGGTGAVYGGDTDVAQGSGAPIAVELLAASDATTTILVTALFAAPPYESPTDPQTEAGRENVALQAADDVIETIRFPSDGGAA